jgi:16S rRNA (guanine527-N7)-methyltransferase
MTLADEAEAKGYCAALTDAEGMARLERLAELLIAENSQQNLIPKPSESALWRRHLADSAQLLTFVPRETASLLDLGTGAGFPGLVLAALRPDMPCVLVESRRRRAEWLVRAAAELGLENCRIEGRRLETVPSFPAGAISARAFAPLPKLLALSARFSTRDTVWLLPKGRSAGQEGRRLPAPIARMFHVKQSATDPEAGILVGKGKPDTA